MECTFLDIILYFTCESEDFFCFAMLILFLFCMFMQVGDFRSDADHAGPRVLMQQGSSRLCERPMFPNSIVGEQIRMMVCVLIVLSSKRSIYDFKQVYHSL